MKILVAVTGASGTPLALRLLEILKELKVERHLIVSHHAQIVAKYEHHTNHIVWADYCEYLYTEDNISASVSSGSYPLNGMVVIPCSMNTLACIAHGIENNLITRAAAVNLKQERKVILVPRESPLSLPQVENLRQAKLAGCSIMLPTLAFYFSPKNIEDLVNYIVGKILELLQLPHHLYPSWIQQTYPIED